MKKKHVLAADEQMTAARTKQDEEEKHIGTMRKYEKDAMQKRARKSYSRCQ